MVLLKQIGTEVEKSAHQSNSMQEKNMTNRKGKSIHASVWPRNVYDIDATVEIGNFIDDIVCIKCLHLYLFRSSFLFSHFILLMRIPHSSDRFHLQHSTICSRFNFQCSHSPFSMAFRIELAFLRCWHSIFCASEKGSGYEVKGSRMKMRIPSFSTHLDLPVLPCCMNLKR